MSSSAINTQVAQLKIGNVQNQADNSAVYSGGIWSLKNSTAVTSVTITDAGAVTLGPSGFTGNHVVNGNVGIGTSNPVGKTYIAGPNTTNIGVATSNAINLAATGGALVGRRVNLGFAVVDSAVNNAACVAFEYTDQSNFGKGDLLFATRSVNTDTAPTERMRIDASGNLLVGATSLAGYSTTSGIYLLGNTPGYFLNNPTNSGGISLALFYSSFSTTNQTKFEVTSEGNVKSRTSSYGGFSDERLKQNITPANSQWDDIKAYEFVKFQMKSEQFSDEENPFMFGVIAQQIEKVSPGLVEEDTKDGMKVVKHSIMFMKAVKALQEAMTRIETLEARLAALESKP